MVEVTKLRAGVGLTMACWMAAAVMAPALAATAPPVAPVQPVTDTYFGIGIVDNYRWLEDQQSPQSKTWMEGQADYTRAMLDGMAGRPKFSAEMQRFLDAEPYSISDVKLAGSRIFYRKRARGVSQETLCVRDAGGAERALLDLNTLSKPGRHVALDGFLPSPDGKTVAVTLSQGGEELGIGRFIDAASGRQLSDQLERIISTGSFSADGRTYYYNALQDLPPGASAVEKYRHNRCKVHVLGTQSAKDPVVLAQGVVAGVDVPDYDWPFVFPALNAPYRVALVIPGVDPNINIYLAPKKARGKLTGWRKVIDVGRKVTDAYLRGDDLYLVSFSEAPNGKLLRLDARDPDWTKAEVVIPPGDLVLTSGITLGSEVLHAGNDALYVRGVRNGQGVALRVPYGAQPAVTPLVLPEGMQVDHITSDENTPGALLRLNSWANPGDFYRYDPVTGAVTASGLMSKNAVDPTDHAFEEVFATGKDGTAIPLSIVYRKGTLLDGSAPTAMIGYGAYGDAWTPGYSRRMNAWIERGGILAVAHVRGGGEKGEPWHLAGYKASKHNTWEDFIACAHYLIDHRYTTSARLGIWSQSAGGILIGRTITTEPDLVAAAVDGVPMSDLLRYETGPNGPGNIPEFGSVKTQDGFDALYVMSSYHHVQPGTRYPAVMVTAGANDPRVDPWQGGKMAAALQAATASNKPVLLRVNFDSGHFADTSAQENSDWTDIFSFFLWAFGDPEFQPRIEGH